MVEGRRSGIARQRATATRHRHRGEGEDGAPAGHPGEQAGNGAAEDRPESRPLITMPTTWPRSPSGAIVLAKGTRIWQTTEVAAAIPIARASTAKLGAAAAPAMPRQLTISRTATSLRRSRRSLSGARKTMPRP